MTALTVTTTPTPGSVSPTATASEALLWLQAAFDRLLYLGASWEGDPSDGEESGRYVRMAGMVLGRLGKADLLALSLDLAPTVSALPIIDGVPYCGIDAGLQFVSSCIGRLGIETSVPVPSHIGKPEAKRPTMPPSWQNVHRWCVMSRVALGKDTTRRACYEWASTKTEERDMPPLVDDFKTFERYARRAKEFLEKHPPVLPNGYVKA